jgi:hypothetical protein
MNNELLATRDAARPSKSAQPSPAVQWCPLLTPKSDPLSRPSRDARGGDRPVRRHTVVSRDPCRARRARRSRRSRLARSYMPLRLRVSRSLGGGDPAACASHARTTPYRISKPHEHGLLILCRPSHAMALGGIGHARGFCGTGFAPIRYFRAHRTQQKRAEQHACLDNLL